MADLCPDCGREYAASYSLWLGSDSFCGMSPVWNRDGERHDDCINECLYASRNRLRVQLSRAQAEIAGLRAVVEAAEAMRALFSPDNRREVPAVAAFDAAMAKLKETKEP